MHKPTCALCVLCAYALSVSASLRLCACRIVLFSVELLAQHNMDAMYVGLTQWHAGWRAEQYVLEFLLYNAMSLVMIPDTSAEPLS